MPVWPPKTDIKKLISKADPRNFLRKIDWKVVGSNAAEIATWTRNKLVTGLVVALPLLATIWVIITIFNFIDSRFEPVVRAFATANQEWLPKFMLQKLSDGPIVGVDTETGRVLTESRYTIFGAGFVLTIIVLVLLGVFFSNVVGKNILNWLDGVMSRIPIVSTLYNAIKQVIDAVQLIGRKDKMSFSKVALVNYPGMRAKLIGFVTNTIMRNDGGRVAIVFIPTAPNPMTGFVIALPYEELEISDMTVEEATKLIVSMGLVSPPIFSSLSPQNSRMDSEYYWSFSGKNDQKHQPKTDEQKPKIPQLEDFSDPKTSKNSKEVQTTAFTEIFPG